MNNKRNLAYYREQKGYTQLEIAEKLLIIQQTVSSWERGRTVPKLHQMKKLSNVLEIDINELFYEEFNVIS